MKKIIIILLLSISFGFFNSCEEFLAEDPKSFAAAENLFNSEKGITQVLHGVYQAGNRVYRGRYYVMMFGITSDEIQYRNSNSSRQEMQNFVFTAQNGNLSRCWGANVYGISRANMVLDYLPTDFKNQEFISRIEAEAKFLRAWYYFSQVRAYGPAPLLTQYIDAEPFPANSTVSEIYDQIVTDLTDAENKLPKWTEIADAERGRATDGAVKSLLAMVYLTRATSEAAKSDDYSKAAAKAKEVIDSQGYGLWDDYNDAFLPSSENGKEDIFSYQFAADAINNSIHTDFSPNPDLYGQSGYGNFYLLDELYDSFEDGDERTATFLKGEYTPEGSSEVFTTPDNKAFTQKFRDPDNKNRNNHGTNLPFIRYSNVLLMYAEALNEANSAPSADAFSALNAVRERANLDALSGLSKEEFRQAIRDERYKEFHGEGIRWFDLVRWGILEERVEAVRPGVDVKMPMHQYFPIPQWEVDANPNMDQNEGY